MSSGRETAILAPGEVRPGHIMLAPLRMNFIAPLSTCTLGRMVGSVRVCIACTRKWIGNAAYIVYVTSLAILRTVTAQGKLAGVTNDKESVLL